MLILSRRAGQSLVIDGGLRITVLATDGRNVRIGIEAPADVRILRGEIVDQVTEEMVRASAVTKAALEMAPVKKG